MAASELDQLAVNTIRGLCMDAIQKAESGHPGTPMGIAPVAYELWQRVLRFDPSDPIWPNRDRFVLSEGHASALLWSLLHLSGVRAVDPDYEVLGQPAVTLDDLKTFRQLGSRCPGHPEYRWTSGVETTTGPLGQGVATSVGMALAGQWLAARYNRDGHTLFDFHVYALAGDGCMMEGISSEAASFAGHQQLANLCWIYDSNRVTIEGHTDITFTEDVAARFLAYGWHVSEVADANDLDEVGRAFHSAKAEHERPTPAAGPQPHRVRLLGRGHPPGARRAVRPRGCAGRQAVPRPAGGGRLLRRPTRSTARSPTGSAARGKAAREAWEAQVEAYRADHPDLAAELDLIQRRELPDGWDDGLVAFPADAKGLATRDSSGRVLNALAERLPWLMGGSADLSPSTKTTLTFDGAGSFQPGSRGGRNLHLGIREHASAAITNGMALTKVRPYWAGFLIFSDYARGAIRLSALMEIPVIHIFTHDSIGVGEDGPTHQPVEQLASLRAMPGLMVFRPADANEVVETWRVVAPLRHEAVALILSRQALPTFDRSSMGSADGVAKGAYVLVDADDGEPDVVLLATGSEVQLAVAAREELQAEGIRTRVVSMPCWELFDRQPRAYRDEVLPPTVKARVGIEQASTLGWDRYVGDAGAVVGMHTFGASAPLKHLLTRFGFTPDRVADVARECLEAVRTGGR